MNLRKQQMKAISLWQPYASLIAFGSKPYETRHWSPPDSLIGQRIAIHAAKRKITRTEYLDYRIAEGLTEIDRVMRSHMKRYHDDWPKLIPYGAVVATANLYAVYKVTREHENCNVVSCSVNFRTANGDLTHIRHIPFEIDEFGDYSVGRHLWEFTDIEVLNPSVQAIGHQGIWNWNNQHTHSQTNFA